MRPLIQLTVELENILSDLRARRFAALMPLSTESYPALYQAERDVTHALRVLNGDVTDEETNE
jgi:hypothetical protein